MAGGDTAVAEQLLADDYLDHDIPGVGEGGKPELVAAVLAVRASFPDIVPTLGPVLAEADLVAVRIQAHGTHTGAPFPPGIPATGRSMTWKEVHIFRCAGGRIAEHWGRVRHARHPAATRRDPRLMQPRRSAIDAYYRSPTQPRTTT